MSSPSPTENNICKRRLIVEDEEEIEAEIENQHVLMNAVDQNHPMFVPYTEIFTRVCTV